MIKREKGFTLVELVITMLMFVLIIAAASNTFTDLLTSFKQQSKLAETNIEGAVGLETLRRDIASAGSGLPWAVTGNVTTWAAITGYTEGKNAGTPNPSTYNQGDVSTGTGGSEPRALMCGNGSGWNSSDHLVIKSISIADNSASNKWTFLNDGNVVKEWVPTTDILPDDSRVIVISPGDTTGNRRFLVTRTGGVYYTTYNNVAGADSLDNGGDFDSSDDTRIVYGVHHNTNLRMPFNRADYFIERPAGISTTCALNTGVLYKATVNHSDGEYTKVPILDCVADMQVAFRRDSDDDGDIDVGYDGNISALTTSEIRQIKEVRVYVLAHEGQKDTTYTHTPTSIRVGDSAMQVTDSTSMSVGSIFNIGATNVNYRWKLYVLVVKTENLK